MKCHPDGLPRLGGDLFLTDGGIALVEEMRGDAGAAQACLVISGCRGADHPRPERIAAPCVPLFPRAT